MLKLFFMPSKYCAVLLWWVFFVTLVFARVRWTVAWTGAWTGQ